MNESVKELIAIGASVGAHCQPCLEYHIKAAIELGVKIDEIEQAIEVGHRVEKGAMASMKKFSTEVFGRITAASPQESHLEVPPECRQNVTRRVVRVYDPAMCCSSGVCGPSVDPVLAQFAGTLQALSRQDSVKIERFNLSQQPQAFVENVQVRGLLANGGEKKLPFIFIDNDLAFQSHYPSRDELAKALGVTIASGLSLQMASPDAGSCGEEGCC